MKFGKKILLSLIVVVLLTAIGMSVYFYQKYNETEAGKTRIYINELGKNLNLEGNKSVIKIIKCNFNEDAYEDYVALIGEEKYDETDTTVLSSELKKLNSNLEMYNNVCIDYFNGETLESKRYDTNKSYGVDVDISFYEDTNGKYVLVSDTSTGNVALLKLTENEFENIISKSFDGDFKGYTINASFNKEEPSKLKVTLDNYGRDYLAVRNEVYELDFSGTDINKDNYRITYMANKYSKFYMQDVDEDGVLEFIGIQNLLYANDSNLQKNVGIVKLVYKFNEKLKLSLHSVFVDK